jgi:hypothetical protein
MKKILLFITALTVSNASFAQTALSEGFEGGIIPATWTTIDTNASNNWLITNNATFLITGTRSAAVSWKAEDQDESLISPSFSLVGYASATFSFKAKLGYEYMVAPFPNGDLFAKISTDGGVTWTQLWREEDQPVFVDYVTQDVSLDLAAYVGQADVMVKFQYVANDADTISVDDILVSGTLGTNDFLASKFSVSPNPAKNIITISNGSNVLVDSVKITDINGRTVKSVKLNNVVEAQINISELNSGVYFLNINSNEGSTTKKIVKN